MRKIRIDLKTLLTFLAAGLMVVVFIPLCSIIQISILRCLIICVGLFSFTRVKNSVVFIELILFIVVILFYFLLGKGLSFNTVGLINWILCFTCALIFSLSIYYLEEKHIEFLIVLLVCLMIYSNVSTIVISIIKPMAVRNFGYYGASELQEVSLSIGKPFVLMYSYGVGEAMAILTPSLLIYGLNSKARFLGILCACATCLSIVSQAMAALTASFILTLSFCAMALFSYLHNAQLTKRLKICFVLFGIILLVLPNIGAIIGNNFALESKLNDISLLFQYGQSSGDVSVRSDLIIQSIKTWLKNPVFGWAEVGGVDIEDGVSMHSALFDYLGLYGLFAVLFFGSWGKTISFQFKSLSKKKAKYYIWGVISLCALLVIKGPVTIETNYFFSVVLTGLLIRGEYYRDKRD